MTIVPAVLIAFVINLILTERLPKSCSLSPMLVSMQRLFYHLPQQWVFEGPVHFRLTIHNQRVLVEGSFLSQIISLRSAVCSWFWRRYSYPTIIVVPPTNWVKFHLLFYHLVLFSDWGYYLCFHVDKEFSFYRRMERVDVREEEVVKFI